MTSTSLWPDVDDVLVPESVFSMHPTGPAIAAPEGWESWLHALFPHHVVHGFADHHRAFWEHVWGLDKESAPRPFVAIWPRGSGKSTSAELACAALGLRNYRGYVLYVRETQELADKSVANIGALLESRSVARHYPNHATRMVGKFGASKGWRRNRLRTAGGFTIDAIGLDTAARGVKVDEQRPDLQVYDDLDNKHDSPETTAKKIATLTTSLIPAGSSNVAVLAIQNLITRDGIFSRLADGRADFLADRIVSGPFPAVTGLHTVSELDQASGSRRTIIVGGTATWAGQSLAICQRQIDLMGIKAFMLECQHDVAALREGLVYKDFSLAHHVVDLEGAELATAISTGKAYGMFDLGKWRFFFGWGVVSRDQVLTVVDEVFSQNETADQRAARIHEQLQRFHVKQITIYGECADEAGLREINGALERIPSPYRFWPVDIANKNRRQGVERVESMLARRALRFRRSMGRGQEWDLGKGAASEGTPEGGSRMLWEIQNWSYPKMPDGKVQKDDPDDASADGADAMDATRYLVMQWLGPLVVKKPKVNPTMAEIIQADLKRFDKPKQQTARYGTVLRQG